MMKPIKLSKEFTIRDSRAVDLYFSEIQKIKPLTAAEEAELCKRIQDGDMKAKEELVLHNLKFVISVAKKYQSLGFKLGDLIAIGNVGLLKAADKFDYSKGFKFISYAVWWIRQQIMSEIGFRNNGVKLPSNRVTVMYKITRFKDKFYTEHQRDPEPEEIAAHFDMDVSLVEDMMAASRETGSLNEPAFDDEDGKEAVEYIIPDTELEDQAYADGDWYRKKADKALSVLSGRDREIVLMYFGLRGRKQTDVKRIAAVFRIREKDVTATVERCLSRMRGAAGNGTEGQG